MSAKDSLLMSLLGCGSLDLKILDDVEYDFDDIIDQLDGLSLQEVGLNGLMRAVVDVGIIHIHEAVDDRICELEAILNERDLDNSEEEELRALRDLDPDRDIRSYRNYYLDTHVWFERNGSIYRRYLAEAVDDFADNTGLEIGGGE